jgi:hypothetical protein
MNNLLRHEIITELTPGFFQACFASSVIDIITVLIRGWSYCFGTVQAHNIAENGGKYSLKVSTLLK